MIDSFVNMKSNYLHGNNCHQITLNLNPANTSSERSRRHFRSEEEAKRVAKAFKRHLGESLDKMNTEDVERFCRNLNSGEAIKF